MAGGELTSRVDPPMIRYRRPERGGISPTEAALALDKKKLPADLKADEDLAAEINVRLEEDGTLTCAAAIALAKAMNLESQAVGLTADALRIRLSQCQLGLFGYPGRAKGWSALGEAESSVPEGFKAALLSAGPASGTLTCSEIWSTAERSGVSRMKAGFIADKLGLRIVGCRIGAF